jgi:4-hydroxybenzoate polyprenyltransferase
MTKSKALAFWQLTRMNRPIGSLLLLWPTLWALFLAADGLPDWHVLIVFVLGVLFMRSAGCVINDFADRKVDGHVKRTANRPLPSGLISSKEALTLFAVLVVCSFLLVLTMNTLTIMLSGIGIVLAVAYPFMKRVTYLPQFVLGLAFSWAIPMAYAAESNQVPPEATAILFGRFDKLIIGLLQLSVLTLLIILGSQLALSSVYYWGVLAAAGFFVYQQWLIKGREREACFKAFLNNNYVGGLVFIAISISVLI